MKLHEMQVPFATSIPYLSCLVIAERSYSICIHTFPLPLFYCNLFLEHDTMARPFRNPQLSIPSHSLTQTDLSEYPLPSSSLAITSSSSRKTRASSRYNFRCSSCWETLPVPYIAVGNRPQAVCRDCWKRMWILNMCWSCGEVVSRKTDVVGFAWCCWHWGCFSCLVCRVSMWLPEVRLSANRTVSPAPSRLPR